MRKPLKFVVLTGPGIPSASILSYMLENIEDFHLSTVFIEGDVKKDKTSPAESVSVPKNKSNERWYSDSGLFYKHFRLSLALPRYYCFKVLSSLFGLNELKFLRYCQNISPGLMRFFCGFPIPEELAGKKVLKTWAEFVSKFSGEIKAVGNFNGEKSLEQIRAENPDIIIGMGTRILSAELLSIPVIGTLNAHSSLLPEYRGGATEFWQLVSGEKETGITIHWMAAKVDEGPICARRSWNIPPRANHHMLRIMSLFYRFSLWKETIDKLLDGNLEQMEQTKSTRPTFRRPNVQQEYDFYVRHRLKIE